MSRFSGPPAGGPITSFHDVAARRGDGLHPLLREALCKSGTVSGPPADSGVQDNKVVPLRTGQSASTGSRAAFSGTGEQSR